MARHYHSAVNSVTNPSCPVALDDDLAHMQAALALAETSLTLSPPNPAVGCRLVSREGRLLGEGATQAVGGPHAEVVALRAAAQAGHSVQGATAYVTLEPCSHHGRTPPCADALVAAGIARVVLAVRDPNPRVAGRGVARLRAAGIQVDEGVMAEAARELNIGFFSRMVRQRPWVRLKAAVSLDGRVALPNGRSQWITGAPAREDGHRFRARAGAILTGSGTALSDDPQMTARLPGVVRQPLRVLVDSQARVPATARLFQPPGSVHVFTAAPVHGAHAAALEALGVQVHAGPAAGGRVDLAALLRRLADLEVNEVHVEAGAGLNGALLSAGLVDELLVYMGPTLLGPGLPMADLPALAALDAAPRLRWLDAVRVGDDLRLRAVVGHQDVF